MKVIAYARCSTADQADHGVTLEAQQAKLAAYASLYDLTIMETILDAGESAKSLNRPGLQRALTMLRRGEAVGLLIVKLDRLTRSVGDLQVLIGDFFGERAGKQLFSVSDNIDTRSASGRLCLNMITVIAQWERETTAERTRDALRHKIARQERVGKLKFGFDLAADGCSLIENVEQQAAIRLMQELRKGGWTLRQIAAELTTRGVATKEGRPAWSSAAVSRILGRMRVA